LLTKNLTKNLSLKFSASLAKKKFSVVKADGCCAFTAIQNKLLGIPQNELARIQNFRNQRLDRCWQVESDWVGKLTCQ